MPPKSVLASVPKITKTSKKKKGPERNKKNEKSRKTKSGYHGDIPKKKFSDYFDPAKPLDVSDLFKGNDMIVVRKNGDGKKVKNIRDRNQTTWVDKYRPITLDEIIGHDDVKDVLLSSIKSGDLPHLLFHGGS